MCEPEVIDTHSYSEVPAEWLEEDSFTISYALTGDLSEQGWASFHDYVPDYSISLRNQVLLQFYNGSLYQMNVGERGKYFGVTYSSIITPSIAPQLKDKERVLYPFLIKNFNWNTDVEDANGRRLLETWSSISIHNSFQGTRIIPIIVHDLECSLLEQYGKYNVNRTKNRWYYNYVFNEKAKNVQGRTFLEKKDRFIVQNTIEMFCNIEDRSKMMDDFVIVVLEFNNALNRALFHYELNMDFLITTQ